MYTLIDTIAMQMGKSEYVVSLISCSEKIHVCFCEHPRKHSFPCLLACNGRQNTQGILFWFSFAKQRS